MFGALGGVPRWAASDGCDVAWCRLFPWLGFHFWMSTFTLVHHTGEPARRAHSRQQGTKDMHEAQCPYHPGGKCCIVDVSLLYRVNSSRRHLRNTAPQSLHSTYPPCCRGAGRFWSMAKKRARRTLAHVVPAPVAPSICLESLERMLHSQQAGVLDCQPSQGETSMRQNRVEQSMDGDRCACFIREPPLSAPTRLVFASAHSVPRLVVQPRTFRSSTRASGTRSRRSWAGRCTASTRDGTHHDQPGHHSPLLLRPGNEKEQHACTPMLCTSCEEAFLSCSRFVAVHRASARAEGPAAKLGMPRLGCAHDALASCVQGRAAVPRHQRACAAPPVHQDPPVSPPGGPPLHSHP